MRLFPANKTSTSLLVLACVMGVIGFAGTAPAQTKTSGAEQEAAALQQLEALNAMSESLGQPSPPETAGKPSSSAYKRSASRNAPSSRSRTAAPAAPAVEYTDQQWNALLNDGATPQSKAAALAKSAERERVMKKNLRLYSDQEGTPPPPLSLRQLQNIAQGDYTITNNISDIVSDGDPGADPTMDIRRDAQKEAALSFGARGGLAKRNFEIMQRLHSFETTLDKVFNFRSLLVPAPSGLLIEPPIVGESLDAMVIAYNGNEAAVADRIYDITKNAKIVSTSRDWRSYLLQAWVSRVPPPPRVLWPKNQQEQDSWDLWVEKGYTAGIQQADEMFEMNVNRLLTDYNGMVRYRTLLAQGMISQPYALHEDRGVTGDKTVMRVGDRAIRITGPSQFLIGSDLWKPADR